MTEPKRWTAPTSWVASGIGETEVVAAADFDRLREERDQAIRAMEAEIDGSREAWSKVVEARRVAGVLADALRETEYNGWDDGNCESYCQTCDATRRDGRHRAHCSFASALAVFDTLTKEKP